jgi:Cytochrome c554 and c-prime
VFARFSAHRHGREQRNGIMRISRDARHLFRLVGLFAVGTLSFFVIRVFLVPHSFGQYGHYRGAAMAEIAAHPAKFAGQATCETCHSDVAQTKSAGKHAGVHCEACHGPQLKHAEDPSIDPGKPDTAVLCVRCHAASAARPKDFPQVDAASHANGVPCQTCHQPHSPAISGTATAAGGTK